MVTNKEYTKLVESENYPHSVIVPIDDIFKDDRGEIINLLFTPINSVAIITSKAGTVRSNHYHKSDFHYLYVLSGKMEYYERDLEEINHKMVAVGPGEMVFTPPNKVHKTVFLEDTVLLSCAKNIRDHQHHEEDVIRLEF